MFRKFRKRSNQVQFWKSQEKSENLAFEFGNKAEYIDNF